MQLLFLWKCLFSSHPASPEFFFREWVCLLNAHQCPCCNGVLWRMVRVSCACLLARWVLNPAIIIRAWGKPCSSSNNGVVTFGVFFQDGLPSLAPDKARAAGLLRCHLALQLNARVFWDVVTKETGNAVARCQCCSCAINWFNEPLKLFWGRPQSPAWPYCPWLLSR